MTDDVPLRRFICEAKGRAHVLVGCEDVDVCERVLDSPILLGSGHCFSKKHGNVSYSRLNYRTKLLSVQQEAISKFCGEIEFFVLYDLHIKNAACAVDWIESGRFFTFNNGEHPAFGYFNTDVKDFRVTVNAMYGQGEFNGQ